MLAGRLCRATWLSARVNNQPLLVVPALPAFPAVLNRNIHTQTYALFNGNRRKRPACIQLTLEDVSSELRLDSVTPEDSDPRVAVCTLGRLASC
jgi:hypothetical protein